jgi:NAD(P)-dependent dehydrogenase (short-subunit alcohol dehydrogenase family)
LLDRAFDSILGLPRAGQAPRDSSGEGSAIREQLIARLPLKRFAQPEEIAAVHAFLVSDDASYVTGQCIFADGGATITVP